CLGVALEGGAQGVLFAAEALVERAERDPGFGRHFALPHAVEAALFGEADRDVENLLLAISPPHARRVKHVLLVLSSLVDPASARLRCRFRGISGRLRARFCLQPKVEYVSLLEWAVGIGTWKSTWSRAVPAWAACPLPSWRTTSAPA